MTRQRPILQASLVAALTVVAVLLTGWQMLRSQARLEQQLLAQAEHRGAQLADAMAGQVDALLATIDLGLRQLRHDWQGDAEAFDGAVRRVLAALPPGAVTHVSVVDADDFVVFDSLGTGRRIYVGDRPHVQAQHGGDDRLRIGEPVRSRLADERWVFFVNRPILLQGRYAGLINFSVSSDYMAQQLRRLELSEADVVGLVHPAGAFLARSRGNEQAMGQRLAHDRPLFADAQASQGLFRASGQTDGLQRIYAWRRLAGNGLIVAVGLSEAAVLAPVAEAVQRDRIVGGGLMAIVTVFGGLVSLLLLRVARQQAAVAESEAFRRRVFDGSHVPIVVLDARSGRVIDCNPAAVTMYGFTGPGQMIGRAPADVSPPLQPGGVPTAERAREVGLRALREGALVFEWLHVRPDGTPWRAEIHLARFESDGRALLQYTLEDITERKRTELALRLTQAAVDRSHDAVFWIDREGRVVRVNEQACRALDRQPDELIGQPIWAADPDFQPDQFEPLSERVLRDGFARFETRHRRRDGSEFPVEVTASHVRFEGVDYGHIQVRDITERQQAEQRLRQLNEELERRVQARTAELLAAKEEAERANHAKSEFLSRMSHELRTPLNAILGFGQLLELTRDRPPAPAHVREILGAGRHLLTLIDDILDLARVESGRITVSLEPVPTLPVVQECLALLRPQAEAASVVLLEPAVDGALQVRADRTRLKQVLLNLLSNAVKYNRPGGSVEVRALPDVDGGLDAAVPSLRIEVHDTGRGLDEHECARLFVPFERLDADERSIQGTGIGLALAKRLVEAMGGTIGVQSTPGLGSRFWVRLPLSATPMASHPAKSPPPAPQPDGAPRRQLLCIEDNPANLRLIESIVGTRPDLSLLSAEHPQRGLELARAERPDLVLLDINLPDLDGYAVLECLREHPTTRAIPVVAISANAMPRDLERARAAGFAAYVTKPVDVERLLQVVDAALASAAAMTK